MKNMRRLACKFELDQSQCKSTQVGGQMTRKLNASRKRASTCESIWPGLYSLYNTKHATKLVSLPIAYAPPPPHPPKLNFQTICKVHAFIEKSRKPFRSYNFYILKLILHNLGTLLWFILLDCVNRNCSISYSRLQ